MRAMQNVRSEICDLIQDVCMKLVGHAHDNEVSLLLGTAAAESALIHRVQIGGGPARGLWQMEPATGVDIFRNYLQFKPFRYQVLCSIWLDLRTIPLHFTPTKEELAHHLEHYDDFACAMARIHYLRDPDPIPESVESQAEYWHRVYKTPGGAKPASWFVEQWETCGCEVLLSQ